MTDSDDVDKLFREAVSTIDAGEVETLQRLIAEYPLLVSVRLESPGPWLRERVGPALDGFFGRPFLLWFVAEDPVRNGRLPANIGICSRRWDIYSDEFAQRLLESVPAGSTKKMSHT